MAKLAVVKGAILKCDKGATPSPLGVITPSLSLIEGSQVATVMDHLPGANIKPFGVCAILQAPCVPVTPVPWVPGETGITLVPSLFPILSNVSILPCAVGGLIQIVSSGQSTVVIDSIFDTNADAKIALAIKKARGENHETSLSEILLKSGWDALTGGVEGYAEWKEKVLRDRAKTFRRIGRRGIIFPKNVRRSRRNLSTRQQKQARRNERKMREKQRKQNNLKSRSVLDEANKPKWAKRGLGVAGHAPAAYQTVNQIKQGKIGDAFATVGGEIVGAGVTGACFSFFTVSTGGLGSFAAGAGCSVAGGFVGNLATPVIKKGVDATVKEVKNLGDGLRRFGLRR